MFDPRLKIYEIFYSIQGESTFAGRPCVLVRLTGCQMRWSWCDTEYAFHGGAWQSLPQVLATVAGFGCPLVEVTGGEPLLQPACLPLLTELCDAGYEVLLETGGGLDIASVDPRVRRILDIKCPASGEAENNRWENLGDLRSTDEIKFVVADRADYDWAKGVIADALILEPTLLIADDPTAGIDVTVRSAVLDILVHLQKQRAFSALIVTADLAEVRRVSTQVAIMHGGIFVGLGQLEEALADPRHPYVAGLARSLDHLQDAG